ncbi:MAG TPA: hypothetical protein VMW30_02185 [Candidatus Paceibacterota bacterium]|nr:hypothetical protein [Candidatus Paceibacterota bacterium]
MPTKAATYVTASTTQARLESDGVEYFIKLLARELHLLDPQGQQIDRIEDTQRFARETAEKVIDASRTWQEHLGTFYDVEGVRNLLSRSGKPLSRQAVSKRKNLLALTTGSKRVVYPSFQFRDRTVVKGLDEVLAQLPEDLLSRWTLASWLVSKEKELGDTAPIEALHQGNVEQVMSIARHWAQSLSA